MKSFILSIAVGFLLCTGVATAKKYPLTASPSVPAAAGHVDIGRDKNGNTKVELKVKHLAAPENLTPPRTAYVVWFQERGSEPVSQGSLKPNKNLEATFKGVTALKSFEVMVTAESDPSTRLPSGSEILRANVQP